MKKKHDNKKFKILGLLIVSLVICLGFVNVNAKTLSNRSDSKYSVSKIANKKTTCEKIADKYVVSSSLNYSGNNVNVVVSYTAKQRDVLTADPSDRAFKIYVYYPDSDRGEDKTSAITKNGSNYVAEFSIGKTTDDGYAIVFVTSGSDNELCNEFNKIDEIIAKYKADRNKADADEPDISQYYIKSGTTIKDEYAGSFVSTLTKFWSGEADELVLNTSYGKPWCDGSVWEYCNQQWVSTNYSQAKVEKMIAKLKQDNADEAAINALGNASSSTFAIPAGALENKSRVVNATCSAFENVPRGSTTELEGDAYYTNSETYYSTETTTEGFCKKECTEVITVQYGPPSASKAGFCFEYKVKVKSKQRCIPTYTEPPPKKVNFVPCGVWPSCNDSAARYDQAGPTEEFDSCIVSCDGGKYSQKCTDKCYKKVYGKTDGKLSFSDNRVSAVQLADSFAILSNSAPTNCSGGMNSISSSVVEEISNAAAESNKGYYYLSGNNVKWKQGGTFWTNLGRYYLVNKPRYTLQTMSKSSACVEIRGGKPYHYYADTDGFKRACYTTVAWRKNNYNGSCSNPCPEVCSWNVSTQNGCSLSRVQSTGYYNTSGTSNMTVGGETYTNVRNYSSLTAVGGKYYFINPEDADYAYAREFDRYKKAKQACMASATCEKTQQSEFTISVENTTFDLIDDTKINKETHSFGPDTISAGLSAGKNLINDNGDRAVIINEDNGTCINENADGYNYNIEWSFPGTWINNKNGDISYQDKNSPGWQLKKNKYCLPLNSTPVNSAWWNWKMEYDKTGVFENSYKSKAETETLKYQILAKSINFGKLNWNISISCFYAIGENYCIGECCDGCCGTDCPSSYDYEVRTVDLRNMFPDENGSIIKEKQIKSYSGQIATVGRDPGYNWTKDAESTKKVEGVPEGSTGNNPNANENYPIDPVKLIGDIQEKAEKGETYSSSNIDYQFELSPDSLRKIRNYYKDKKSKNYTNFANTFVNDNGVTSYSSPLIRQTEFLNSSEVIVKRKLGCNNTSDTGCK